MTSDSQRFYTNMASEDPPTPVDPTDHAPVKSKSFGPLGLFSVLRNVGVRQPCWFTLVRVLQLLLAGSVVGLLAWNLVYVDFEGYHAPTVAMLVVAAWTILPTTILTFPLLRRGKQVIDPRLTLFCDGLACVAWGMTFAALNALQWEVRGRFWAIGDPPPTTIIAERGLRTQENGMVSNADVSMAWSMGLIAAYFGAGECILFAFTTLTFAYYYHSALVADTATHLPRNAASPLLAPPNTAVAGDLEAGQSPTDKPSKSPTESIITKIFGPSHPSKGTLTKKQSKDDLKSATAGKNDSGILAAGENSKTIGSVKIERPAVPTITVDEAGKTLEGKVIFPTGGNAS